MQTQHGSVTPNVKNKKIKILKMNLLRHFKSFSLLSISISKISILITKVSHQNFTITIFYLSPPEINYRDNNPIKINVNH